MVVGQRKPMYKIRSCDGQILVVEDWLVEQSKSFSLVFSYMKDSAQPLQTTVSSYILVKIIEWCYHHRNDETDVFHHISEWDADFLEANNEVILHLIEAAYRLEIRGLVNIACRAVSMMTGNSMREVKLMLRVGGLDDEFEDDESLEDEEEEEEDAERLPPIPAA